jgi:hypothetical protein
VLVGHGGDAAEHGLGQHGRVWWPASASASVSPSLDGGNVQVVTAPGGWPLWTSDVRPGREHNTTCARAHPDLLPALEAWTDLDHAALADLGYEGENQRLTCPIKATPEQKLTVEQRTVDSLHAAAALVPVHHQHGRTTGKGSLSLTHRRLLDLL